MGKALQKLHHLFTWRSFRNKLFQCGSPVGSQVLLENVFLCGVLFMGLGFRPGACSSQEFKQGFTTSFRAYPPGSRWRAPWALGVDICFSMDHHGPQQDNEAVNHHCFYHSCRGIPALALEHLLPLLRWPCCIQDGFSHIFLLLSPVCCTCARLFASL